MWLSRTPKPGLPSPREGSAPGVQGEALAEPGRAHLVLGTAWATVWAGGASGGAFVSGFPDQDLVGGHGVRHAHPTAAVCLPLPSPHLHQLHHLQVCWGQAAATLPATGGGGWALRVPHLPSSPPPVSLWVLLWCRPSQCIQHFLCWLVPLPQALRVPCACSEEVPLRTGPEGLQELDSLDTEKSLLCSPGSGYGPRGGLAGGRHSLRGAPGRLPHRRLWSSCAAGQRSWQRHQGLRETQGPVLPSCSRAGACFGARP